jgi:hypothetical protein
MTIPHQDIQELCVQCALVKSLNEPSATCLFPRLCHQYMSRSFPLQADFPPPPPTNYTWGPANKTESFFFVCPLGTHCRLVRTSDLQCHSGY